MRPPKPVLTVVCDGARVVRGRNFIAMAKIALETVLKFFVEFWPGTGPALSSPRIILGQFLALVACCALFSNPAWAQSQEGPSPDAQALVTETGPTPIVVEPPTEPLDIRLARKITLDVRDMNIIDVVKFLALKGEFNVVGGGSIQGRVTILLKNVSIKDVLDIVLISSNLAYDIKNDIVRLMTASDYESLYGKNFSDYRKVAIVRLNYAKPGYVLEALDSMKSSLGRIIIDEDTGSVVLIDTELALAQMQKAIKELENPLETYVYTLQYSQADVVAEKLRPRLEGNRVGTIVSDERSNQLIVRAIPGRKSEIDDLVRSLDVRTKEVMIDARVLQIIFKPNSDMGIDWDLDFQDSSDPELKKLTFSNVWLNDGNLASSDNLSKFFTKMAIGDIDQNHFAATLKFLKQVSDTKILSNPKLLVTHGQEARIHIGDTVPYIISTTSGTGDNAITSEDVRFVDVGIKLNVIPLINDDGYVTMQLKPEISTVITKIDSQGGGIPQVNKTEVETNIMVKDGNTVVLGGLKSDDKSHVKRGFPWLGELPVLGRLFSSTVDKITSTEIVIFITPHIVSGAHDADSIRGTIKPFADYSHVRDLRKTLVQGLEEEPSGALKRRVNKNRPVFGPKDEHLVGSSNSGGAVLKPLMLNSTGVDHEQ